MMVETKLAKLSICPCGFSVLRDEIPLGTVYMVDPGRTEIGGLICGNCRRHTVNLKLIWAVNAVNGHTGLLPIEIFDITKVH